MVLHSGMLKATLLVMLEGSWFWIGLVGRGGGEGVYFVGSTCIPGSRSGCAEVKLH